VLVPEAGRLRLVALVHMPLGLDTTDDGTREREGAVLSAAASVVTTSAWARRALLQLYSLPGDRVHVAEPGADAADLARGTATAGALLSVAAVIPGKGHDVLLDALAMLAGLRWHCLCVGSLERDPAFAEGLRRRVVDSGMDGRVGFSGPQTGADLARSYGGADVLVLPSRAETYGMVVTEALARGLPVVASEVGGVPEALGHGADDIRPGLLVPPDDPAALRDALRTWLEDADLRRRLRRAARERRESLSRWSTTASVVADVLVGAAR
jgi:glycosyltransferase involved in cell wall biosynthesis